MSQTNPGNAPSPANDPRWSVFDYEVNMRGEMRRLLSPENLCWPMFTASLRNAVVESLVLHTRILIDILLSRGTFADDIKLKNLLPSFESPDLQTLEKEYGKTDQKGKPCWEFNKMMAHATSIRGTQYDYTTALNTLSPLIEGLLSRIDADRRKMQAT